MKVIETKHRLNRHRRLVKDVRACYIRKFVPCGFECCDQNGLRKIDENFLHSFYEMKSKCFAYVFNKYGQYLKENSEYFHLDFHSVISNAQNFYLDVNQINNISRCFLESYLNYQSRFGIECKSYQKNPSTLLSLKGKFDNNKSSYIDESDPQVILKDSIKIGNNVIFIPTSGVLKEYRSLFVAQKFKTILPSTILKQGFKPNDIIETHFVFHNDFFKSTFVSQETIQSCKNSLENNRKNDESHIWSTLEINKNSEQQSQNTHIDSEKFSFKDLLHKAIEKYDDDTNFLRQAALFCALSNINNMKAFETQDFHSIDEFLKLLKCLEFYTSHTKELFYVITKSNIFFVPFLFDDVSGSAIRDLMVKSKKEETDYVDYYTQERLSVGKQEGRIFRGTLYVNSYNCFSGIVHAKFRGKNIQIKIVGKKDMNRAFNLDTVFVEIKEREANDLIENDFEYFECADKTNIARHLQNNIQTEILNDIKASFSSKPAYNDTTNDKNIEGNKKSKDQDAFLQSVNDVSKHDKKIVEDESLVNFLQNKNIDQSYDAEKTIHDSEIYGRVVGIAKRSKNPIISTITQVFGLFAISTPLDRKLPKFRIQTSQAEALLNKRILCKFSHWDVDSIYPHAIYVRKVGMLGDLEAEIESIKVSYGINYQNYKPDEYLDDIIVSIQSNIAKNSTSFEKEFNRTAGSVKPIRCSSKEKLSAKIPLSDEGTALKLPLSGNNYSSFKDNSHNTFHKDHSRVIDAFGSTETPNKRSKASLNEKFGGFSAQINYKTTQKSENNKDFGCPVASIDQYDFHSLTNPKESKNTENLKKYTLKEVQILEMYKDAILSEKSTRLDCRNLSVVSIDPVGCTDIDDAVSLVDNGDNFEIGVHIADVSYFIEMNSLLDLEARNRGTTVYLTDRRYDMLPDILSSNLCSLRENEDRLAFSVFWIIDKKRLENGNILDDLFDFSLIEVEKRYKTENRMNKADMKTPNASHFFDQSLIKCENQTKKTATKASKVLYFSNESPIKGVYIAKTIIRSRKSFTYEEAQMEMSKKTDLGNIITKLNAFAKKLKKERIDRGCLELSSTEVKINFRKLNRSINNHESNYNSSVFYDTNNICKSNILPSYTKATPQNKDLQLKDSVKPQTSYPNLKNMPIVEEIEEKKLLDTNSLIEELMLFANITVAKAIYTNNQHAILRRHPKFADDSFIDLKEFLSNKNIDLNYLTSKELNTSLKNIQEKDLQQVIKKIVTRSMNQAVYFSASSQPTEEFLHYGLAFPIYTHFTSPIRRYADIMVHRQLNDILPTVDHNHQDPIHKQEQLETFENSNNANDDVEFDLNILNASLDPHRAGKISEISVFNGTITDHQDLDKYPAEYLNGPSNHITHSNTQRLDTEFPTKNLKKNHFNHQNNTTENRTSFFDYDEICRHINYRNRSAMLASLEIDKLFVYLYIKNVKKLETVAFITKIRKNGIVLNIKQLGIEETVRIGEEYIFNETKNTFSNNRRSFTLYDSIAVSLHEDDELFFTYRKFSVTLI